MRKIAIEVQRCIHHMQGQWMAKKSSYEKRLCRVLNWQVVDSRYYDAVAECNALIEIKKGINGMHFDLIRYSEILLGRGVSNTVTVYFHWKKQSNQVVDVCIIDTKVLTQFLQINNYYASIYSELKNVVPRGVSVMANATSKDLRQIADFVVLADGRIIDQEHIDKSKYLPHLIEKKKKETTPMETYNIKQRKSKNKASILYYVF